MATQAEAAAQLQEANQSLQKIGTEVDTLLQKVADLEAAAQNNADEVSPALQEAIDAVVAQAKAVDEKVPDAVSARRKHGK